MFRINEHGKISPVKFRTMYDRLEAYSDGEYYDPDTSLTRTEDWEPIESIVRRMTRGEVVNQIHSVEFDTDSGDSVDDILDNPDPTQSPDWDLADSTAVLGALGAKLDTSPGSLGPSGPEDPTNPPADPLPDNADPEKMPDNQPGKTE